MGNVARFFWTIAMAKFFATVGKALSILDVKLEGAIERAQVSSVDNMTSFELTSELSVARKIAEHQRKIADWRAKDEQNTVLFDDALKAVRAARLARNPT